MGHQQRKADLLQQAISHHQAGELQQAALIYEHILASSPDHADANYLLGLIAHQTGNNGAAAQLVSKAIEKNPAQPLYYSNLGIIRMALRQWDDAISAFHAALQSNQGDVKAHINLGIALEEKGKIEEAAVSYKNALSLAPGDMEALNRLGNAYARLQRLEEATAAFENALKIDPSSIATLNNLGIALRDHGKLDESIATYRRALKIHPERIEIFCNLAMALLDIGQLQEAEESCRSALSFNPAFAEAYKQLSDALHFQQRTTDWNAMLDTALAQGELSKADRNYLFISKAIIAWVHQDVDACKDLLQSAQSILHCPVNDKVTYSATGYYKFLSALVESRHNHPQWYAKNGAHHVHIIGDSHSLSYTGTVISLEGIKYKVVSHLIMGCKAWHLVKPGMNQFKASFDLAIGKLPQDAKAIISIGEIDCRTNEGIFPAHKKYGKKLQSSVKSLVNNFVQYVEDKAGEKKLKLIFYGVPAPNCSLSNLSRYDKRIFLKTVELFNICLAKAAASTHSKFIDAYQQTVTEDGIANGRHHIDAFHMRPDFLAQACRRSGMNKSI